MKYLQLISTGFALAAFNADASGDYIYSRPVSEILGSTHVSGRYYLTDKDFLNEGAQQLMDLGMQAFKGWFGPGFRTAYPHNSKWPDDVESLVELAQTPYFSELFNRPFKTYSLVVGEFKYTQWKKGLTDEQKARIESEFYTLTVYLLETYKHSGKTFILQNWEGDNALRAWDIEDPEVYQQARKGMIDWLNARQDGIIRARKKVGIHGVRVVGAVEVTRTPAGRQPFNHPLVIDDVVPHTRSDLYALSTWGTRLPGDEKLILPQLDYMASRAPASELYGEKNIMLGEFGAYELTYTSPEHNYEEHRTGITYGEFNETSAMGQLTANRKQLEYALQWGVQYALYWELYCNGLRDGLKLSDLRPDENGNDVATPDQLKGVWLIRPDGSKVPTWYYFHNLIHSRYIADSLLDWSRVHARSPQLQTPEGLPFIGNQSAQEGSLLYITPDLAEVHLRVLHANTNTPAKGIRIYASHDQENWTLVPATYTTGPELSGSGWRYAHLSAQASAIPPHSQFLKVELTAQSADKIRLNKVVTEARGVASDPNRSFYRFAELDGILINGQPVEGFDSAITRYQSALQDGKIPTVEALPADPELQIHIKPPSSPAEPTSITVAFSDESPRIYRVFWTTP